MWTGAFPNIGIAGLAWVAPGFLAAATLGKPGAEAFRIGYVGGLAHYWSMLYWLLLIPYRWQGIPLAPAVGWLALGGFLALLPGVWAWLVCPVAPPDKRESSSKTGEAGVVPQGPGLGSSGVLSQIWAVRALWAISGAAIWVALEMIIARLFGGFPWDLLGVSQYQLVPLIQLAAVTGVYGISFLVAWLSLSILSAMLTMIRRPGRSSAWIAEVFIPVLVMAVAFNMGVRNIREGEQPGRSLRVTLIQPSIPQTVIWDAAADVQRFERLVQWSDQILSTNKTDLLIWPESAVPRMLRYDTNTFQAVTNLAQRRHVWMIVGSDDAEPRTNAANPDDSNFYNSSFLVSPQGELRERYIKRNLVMFGEYLPLQRWLPFLKVFTPITGGYTPGTQPVEFSLGELDVQTSVLICFEDVFPQLGRSEVKPDTAFLVNITNDGWFGESAEQWQHGVSAIFRAVENGVPLVRCTNNGLTCWADARGRIREYFRDSRGTIYGPGFLTVEVPVPMQGELRALTFYTRHGDWFGWLCVVIAAVILIGRIVRPRL